MNLYSLTYDFAQGRHRARSLKIDHKHLKSLKNLVIRESFGSLGVVFEKKLALKNCKISGWQKCYCAHTFLVQF